MSPASRALIGGGLGVLGSEIENRTLLSDASPKIKGINSTLGAATLGAAALAGSKYPVAAISTLAAWPFKQMALLGLKTGKDYVDMQIPISENELETSRNALDTALIQSEAAKRLSTSDIARLGLAGAGIAGAGGLGYYLYKTLGPGKMKSKPKVTVTLDGKNKGTTQVEGDMDTLEMSRRLHTALRRDARKQMRIEADTDIKVPKEILKKREEERKKRLERDSAKLGIVPEELHSQLNGSTPALGLVRSQEPEPIMSRIYNLLAH